MNIQNIHQPELDSNEITDLYAFFQNEISQKTMLELINKVEDINPAHLFLLISTDGGDPREPIRFFSYIQSKGIRLTTINIGCCGSAGVPLFLCGDERICPEYCFFVLHEPSGPQFYTSLKMAKKNIIFNEFIHQNIYNFAHSRCGIEKNEWDIWHECENTAISSQEALQRKIATSSEQINIPRNAKIIRI